MTKGQTFTRRCVLKDSESGVFGSIFSMNWSVHATQTQNRCHQPGIFQHWHIVRYLVLSTWHLLARANDIPPFLNFCPVGACFDLNSRKHSAKSTEQRNRRIFCCLVHGTPHVPPLLHRKETNSAAVLSGTVTTKH